MVGGYIWEFSLNVSLCASGAQLRNVTKRPANWISLTLFPVVFALESALFLWLKQLEKMFIFCDSHEATTNFLEKLVIFRDSHAKSDHFS